MLADRFITGEVIRCYQNDRGAACNDLTDIGDRLFKQRGLGCQSNNESAILDQRNRAMLQLTRRVCLRVDIGNLLQLKGCLESCGIVQTAAEEKDTGAVCIQRSDALHIRLTFERFGDAFRQPLKLSTERTLVADRDQTAHARNLYGNQIQCGKLRGVSLGRCNSDLRAGPGVQDTISFACDRRGDHIYNRDGECTGLLRQTHCSKRISRLTGLTDYDAHILFADDRVFIAEFACDLGRAADTAHCLDDALADHACMQRRATADDVDVFNVAQTLIGQSVVLETNGIVLDTGGHGICNSLRLFHDLLEHEVLIAALFCCGHIPVDGLNFLSNQNMSVVNRKAYEGTVIAHTEGGVPNIVLEAPELNEYELGYIIYFFEKACAISGYLLGVNPFNQPGVESYKKNMFALLGKPGYEAQKADLEAKLGL